MTNHTKIGFLGRGPLGASMTERLLTPDINFVQPLERGKGLAAWSRQYVRRNGYCPCFAATVFSRTNALRACSGI